MFKRNDWIVGVFSVLLGVFVLIRSNVWHEQTSLDVAGPGGVPTILAWGILIIGIIHLIGAFITPKLPEEEKTKWSKELQELMPVLQITLVCAIYLLILETLGYLIATPLLIFAILWIVKVRSLKNLLLTSISTTAILFCIFYFGLQVKLPMGFLKAFLS